MSPIKKLSLCAALAMLAAVPTQAQAGYKAESSLGCYKRGDGSGYCYGSFIGFRNNADANAYMVVSEMSGYKWFQAQLNGAYYSCTPDATTAAFWGDAVSAKYIDVEWSASGVCNSMIVSSGSLYGNY